MFQCFIMPGEVRQANKMGQWVKGTCVQTWPPEFNSQNAHEGRRELTLGLFSDLHMNAIESLLPQLNSC